MGNDGVQTMVPGPCCGVSSTISRCAEPDPKLMVCHRSSCERVWCRIHYVQAVSKRLTYWSQVADAWHILDPLILVLPELVADKSLTPSPMFLCSDLISTISLEFLLTKFKHTTDRYFRGSILPQHVGKNTAGSTLSFTERLGYLPVDWSIPSWSTDVSLDVHGCVACFFNANSASTPTGFRRRLKIRRLDDPHIAREARMLQQL